jgi:hypothetical protein
MHRRFLTTSIFLVLILPIAPATLATLAAAQPPPELPVTGGVILQSFEFNELITGAPYSAEARTEIVQTLADGNRIVRQTSASIARDSRGRIRREQTLAAVGTMIVAGEQSTVTISDPESGIFYVLDPNMQVAMRHRTPQTNTFTAAVPADGTGMLRTFRREGAGMAGTAAASAKGAFFGVAGPAGEPAWGDIIIAAKAPQGAQGAPAVKTESLGRREIEGVMAEGTRTTITIPAGAIGNERALESTSERWFSPDLRIVILSDSVDPRFGKTTYQLTRIIREEPGSELFEVPAGYRVVDGGKPPR